MSAFVVGKETIDKAVFLLKGDKPCEWGDLYGQQLWQMNCDAVNQRYSGHVPQEPAYYRYLPKQFSRVVALKGLQCLIYQCSEGDVPKRALYKELVDTQNKICR